MTTRHIPKHIPALEFLRRMHAGEKIVFFLLLLLTAATVTGLVLAAQDPTRWTVTVRELTEQHLQEVKLMESTVDGRTIGLHVGGWLQTGSYVAGPIVPVEWITLVFATGFAAGLAFLLAGLNRIRGLISMIGYGLLFFMFALHGITHVAVNPTVSIITFSAATLLLVPAWLFSTDRLEWSVPVRGVIYFLIIEGLFVAVWLVAGWQELHSVGASIVPGILLLLLLWLNLNGREVLNVLILLGTNSRNPRYRLPLPMLLALTLMLAGLMLVMAQKTFRWGLINDLDGFPFRPLHLFALVALVAPFTSQNLWVKLKDSISNVAFTLGMLGFSLLLTSSLFFYIGQGEYTLLNIAERMTIGILFANTVFYAFYVFYNFRNSLHYRDCLYYLLMMPRRLMYLYVPVAVILAYIGFEAADGGKINRMFKTVVTNQNADRLFIAGKDKEALIEYQLGAMNLPGDVKSNYNLASLFISVKDNEEKASEHYEKAFSFIPFPPAALNKAMMELQNEKPWDAHNTLDKISKQADDPRIFNNLALVCLAEKQPDSAIYYLKKAIQFTPDQSTPPANLGFVYLAYGKKDEARKFLQAAVEAPSPGPVAMSNATFYNLAFNDTLKLRDEWIDLSEVKVEEGTMVNMAYWFIRRGDFQRARKVCDVVLAQRETPSAMFLDGMLKFESGEYALGYSRIQFLGQWPEFAGLGWHYLGYAYFKRHVPEMAAEYFRRAAEAGYTADLLNEARMQIDAGNHEAAFMQLSASRGIDEKLMIPASHEIAMLQAAHGFAMEAMIEWDMQDITSAELLQVGRYAGIAGNIPVALDFFSRFLEQEPKSVEPFLLMGRMRLQRGDSLAINEIREGLKRSPDHYELNRELVGALLLTGQTSEAKAALEKIKKGHEKDPWVRLCDAKILLAEKDTVNAAGKLKELIKDEPLFQPGVIALAAVYEAQGESFEGQILVTNAITLNPRNSDFHWYLARFEKGLGRAEETATAARQAIALNPDDKGRVTRISEEFKEELKQFNPQAEQ